MSLVVKPYVFSAGATIIASEHNSNFDIIYNDFNGNITNANIATAAAIAYSKLNLTASIVNADISGSAAIVDTKLAQLTSGSKVNISALVSGSQGMGTIMYYSGTRWTTLAIGTTSGAHLISYGTRPKWQ